MKTKVVIGCYEIPGFGGASTASYRLFEKMQRDGLNVSYLNLIEKQDVDFYSYIYGNNFENPKGLRDVDTAVLKGHLYKSHPELTNRISQISPDLMIGVGFIAAFVMKKAFPRRKLLYLTTGCQQMKDVIVGKQVKSFIDQKKLLESAIGQPDLVCMEEEEAVEISDLIVTHSAMTRFLYERFFPFHAGKIYSDVIWFAEWIHEEALEYYRLRKPFAERDIDLLFVSSSWSRPEKNYDLVRKIVSCLKNRVIHIVGETEENSIPAIFHGLITNREELFQLLGRTKTVVCPSLFDAAPGILFEASAMECNVVTSRNCGNWEICHDELLADPLNEDVLLQKIQHSLSGRFQDNMNYFLKKSSYENLIETISVFN